MNFRRLFYVWSHLAFPLAIAICCTLPALAAGADDSSTVPTVSGETVFEEVDGQAAVEAEHFYKQTRTDTRAWHIVSAEREPNVKPDPDPSHARGASGGAYLEILPDNRVTHDDKLVRGLNFTEEPGTMAVLHYRVHINNPGRYHVWVRSFSTGTEDNGVHVGLDGRWPETGRRWQTTGKRRWAWGSKQRTAAVHVGEPYKLYLDIEKPGLHEIMFAMREDGFEMDKFLLTQDRQFAAPDDTGPAPRVKRGTLP